MSDELAPDEQPEASSIVCPECGRADFGEGVGGRFALGRHRKAEHREQWEAGRAPKAKARTARPKPPPRDRPPRAERSSSNEVRDNVLLFYGVVADLWIMRGDQCGLAMREALPGIAGAWAELAKTNDNVRRFWTGGGGAVSWVGLGMAHMPIAMSLYGHHVIPRREARRQAAEAQQEADLFGPEPQTVVYATVAEPAESDVPGVWVGA